MTEDQSSEEHQAYIRSQKQQLLEEQRQLKAKLNLYETQIKLAIEDGVQRLLELQAECTHPNAVRGIIGTGSSTLQCPDCGFYRVEDVRVALPDTK